MQPDIAAPITQCCISASIGSFRQCSMAPARSRQASGKTIENAEIENPNRTLTTFLSAILANLTFHAVGGMGMIDRRTRRGARCFRNRRSP
jgi:hypothetical protein